LPPRGLSGKKLRKCPGFAALLLYIMSFYDKNEETFRSGENAKILFITD